MKARFNKLLIGIVGISSIVCAIAFMSFSVNTNGQMIELAPVLSQGTLKYDMDGDGIYEVQFHADDFTNIKSEITDLNQYINTSVTDIDTNLTALSTSANERFATANGRITSTNNSRSSFSTSVDTKFSAVNSSITSINTQLGNLNTSISTINGRLGGLNSSVSSINSDISTLNSSLTTLQSDVVSGRQTVALALRGKGASSRFNSDGNLTSNNQPPAFSDLEAGVADVYTAGDSAGYTSGYSAGKAAAAAKTGSKDISVGEDHTGSISYTIPSTATVAYVTCTIWNSFGYNNNNGSAYAKVGSSTVLGYSGCWSGTASAGQTITINIDNTGDNIEGAINGRIYVVYY